MNKLDISTIVILTALFFASCNQPSPHTHAHEDENPHDESEKMVHLSRSQFSALELRVDTLPLRSMSAIVEANGQLEVPPQNEANVTAIIGANVRSIKVIEGDKVAKGQVLAWLSHPDLIRLQTDYLNAYNNLSYLEQEYNRQKKLLENEVGSGKEFQKIQSDYDAAKAMVKGLSSQLRLLGMNPERIQEGDLYESAPVPSPIEGYIRKIHIKTGQYVSPQLTMMEVVNNHHIHADLMVFEKDVYKVRQGQKVIFTVETLPGEELEAEIYSVGKSFEQEPKAVHIHAEIENKKGYLIPGMYISGRIVTGDVKTIAVPESAVVREADSYFIFAASYSENDEEWHFRPIEVITGISSNNWVEVKLMEEVDVSQKFVMNNAYYLMAEMKKGEGGGHHH